MKLAVALAMAACGGAAPAPTSPGPGPTAAPQRVETAEVTIAVPAGYKDITASMKPHIPYVEVALEGPSGVVIVFQKAPPLTETTDEAGCAAGGTFMTERLPQLPGKPAKLRGTRSVAWTGGTGCEYDYLTPDGQPTVLVEFHRAARADEIWTMTCQHADGDQAALAACRSSGAAFVQKPSGP